MKRVLQSALHIACVGILATTTAHAAPLLPHRIIGTLAVEAAKEPSGICLHISRNTLFVADDRGALCEFTLDGKLIQRKKIGSGDLEGITHNPATGLLYIAVEGAELILEIDPATLGILRTFQLPRDYDGVAVMKAGGSGIEAITFIPNPAHPHGGTFLVANQSKELNAKEDYSALIEVELPLTADNNAEVKLIHCIRAPQIDISGLHWHETTGTLYAISDATDCLMAFSRDLVLLQTWQLPGKNQEGITLLPDGTLYIAQDSGGILMLATELSKRPTKTVPTE